MNFLRVGAGFVEIFIFVKFDRGLIFPQFVFCTISASRLSDDTVFDSSDRFIQAFLLKYTTVRTFKVYRSRKV